MKKITAKPVKGFTQKKKIFVPIACVLVVCLIVTVVALNGGSSDKNSVYREATVEYGNLTVGITESGSVDIGTIEQTFDLDMSALKRVTTNNSNSSSGSGAGFSMGGSQMGGAPAIAAGGATGGNDFFGQMFNIGSNSSSSSQDSDSNLVISSVLVNVGQTISKGDVIFTLEEEGVEELKSELESNVDKASADLEALVADNQLSTITAEYTKESALLYGDYAEKEKNATIASLSQDITDANNNLAEAEKTLSRYEEQLATAKADYDNAVIAMNNAIWARDHANKDSELGNYVTAFNEATTATNAAETLENKVSQLEEKIESAKSTISRCKTNIAKAKRAYDTGVLSAEETYELKMLAYNTADETYDVTLGYLETSLTEQQENYDYTLSKWNEFNSYISGLDILSEYNGVITDISLTEGDKLTTGAVVLSLYDADDVTMTVTISESDINEIEIGGVANVSLLAYPDEIFEATVSEISDASTDSSGNTTYDVTVKIAGDVSRLFQGMSGEVTFITKQVKTVFYVTNRAIIRENGLSYVKVKKENGQTSKVKVETGFSDGVNVEIISGLTEGQTVIIEKGDK